MEMMGSRLYVDLAQAPHVIRPFVESLLLVLLTSGQPSTLEIDPSRHPPGSCHVPARGYQRRAIDKSMWDLSAVASVPLCYSLAIAGSISKVRFFLACTRVYQLPPP